MQYSKIVDTDRRSDIAPLVETFPGLGAPVKATWYFGHYENVRPNDFATTTGPYWLDAVIELEPDVTAKLLDAASVELPSTPDEELIARDLRSLVPKGEGTTSGELSDVLTGASDDGLTQPEISPGATLYPRSNVLVLEAEFTVDGAGPLLAATEGSQG